MSAPSISKDDLVITHKKAPQISGEYQSSQTGGQTGQMRLRGLGKLERVALVTEWGLRAYLSRWCRIVSPSITIPRVDCSNLTWEARVMVPETRMHLKSNRRSVWPNSMDGRDVGGGGSLPASVWCVE